MQLSSLLSSPSITNVSVALLVVLIGGYVSRPSAQERAVRHLPTPSNSRLWMTLQMMTTHGPRIYDWFAENCKRFDGKPWRMQLLGRPIVVVVSSPALVEDILKTQFDNFVKGEITSYGLFDVLGNGIFAADGDLWSHQRKTASHLFSLSMMREIMEESVRSYCAVLCAKLQAVASSNDNVVEVKRLLDLFTMDVFTKIGFGVDFGGLSGKDTQAFIDAFLAHVRGAAPSLPAATVALGTQAVLNVGMEAQLKRDMEVIDDTIHGIITRCMEEKEEDDDNDGGTASRRRNLVGLFLDKSQGEAVDATLIRDMSVNFIGAGRDTTSQTMTWFLLMMNRHPDVLTLVQKEIETKLPHLKATNAAIPTMEDVQDLPYLEAAIKESLRLNPVVAVTSRSAVHDTTLSDGTFIKGGTRVVFASYAMARMPSIWGDDAEQFDPTRWLDASTGRLLPISPYQNPVFLGGPRICLGMKFAFMEIKITLVALLSRFELQATRDPFDYTYKASLTMTIRGAVDMRVTRREAAACD